MESDYMANKIMSVWLCVLSQIIIMRAHSQLNVSLAAIWSRNWEQATTPRFNNQSSTRLRKLPMSGPVSEGRQSW